MTIIINIYCLVTIIIQYQIVIFYIVIIIIIIILGLDISIESSSDFCFMDIFAVDFEGYCYYYY